MNLTGENGNHAGGDPWKTLQAELQVELERARQELKEVNLMVDQGRVEVGKLAQKNASLTAHLRQVHSLFDSLPREDIRQAYDDTLEAQQRLFLMRGQQEKLEADRAQIDKRVGLLEKVLAAFTGGPTPETSGTNGFSSGGTLEMLIQAQETERQRLSRQMHDGPAQALSNFILQTEIAMRLFDLDKAKAREELALLKDSATATFQKVRDFIFELRPMMLDDLGLVPTVKRYARAYQDQTGLVVQLAFTGQESRLEPYLEVMIFRAVQTLLSNAFYQGQASEARVQIDMGEENVRVVVEDNGREVEATMLEKDSGLGLKLIKERVEMVGGEFDLIHVSGQGTRVRFQIPTQAHLET
ncbi:MAG TPA: histidine kinase [Anaerolineales bacterium]|nr:histidine kinase [Anaerolineales bacterium]